MRGKQLWIDCAPKLSKDTLFESDLKTQGVGLTNRHREQDEPKDTGSESDLKTQGVCWT